MIKISKFSHILDLGNHIAIWHSLKLKPVFLEKETYKNLLHGICDDYVYKELKLNKIIVSNNEEDSNVKKLIRQKAPKPSISLCYFILSEGCNLACKYCFLGNNSEIRKKFSKNNMTKDTAEKCLMFFIKQLEKSDIDFTNYRSQIIFFGGEPLINYDVLIYVAKRVNELKDKYPVLKSTDMTVISNGTLLNKYRIKELDELGVIIGISIDGSSREANNMRVTPSGKEVYSKIINALDMCKELNVKPSLSITLSEQTINDLDGIIDLLKKYEVTGLGYNILLSSGEYQPPKDYYEKASKFIIDSFEIFREIGIYEDRIMRKLKTFTSSSIYLSDCGATAGGQLVFVPDGRVGICHGLLADKEDFDVTIDDDGFDAKKHPTWLKWSKLVPVNIDSCYKCEALGICGGGCPINAREINPDKGLTCIDERQCIHAKRTLEYLIKDLYKKALCQ